VKAAEAEQPAAAPAANPPQPPPRAQWEAMLQQVEAALATQPEAPALLFQRACLLAELGRIPEARNEYIKVLQREPSHLGALNNLGNLLLAAGYRSAARIAYQEAVRLHPDDPMSRTNLGNVLLTESQMQMALEKPADSSS